MFVEVISSFSRLIAAFIIIFSLLVLVRRAALPKPVPGIPYDAKSANSIFGDVVAFANAPNEREWMVQKGVELRSPIYQIFLRPLQRPVVVIADFYETMDISMRRLKEFDRSELTISMFDGIVPEQQITLRSADPRFKKSKELVRDLMTPSFLHGISGRHIYSTLSRLLDLWDKKLDMSENQPFIAGGDIHHALLDMIVMGAYGLDEKRTQLYRQLQHLKGKSTAASSTKENNADYCEFEHVPLDEELAALATMSDSSTVGLRSPFPRLHHFLYRNLSPQMRRATFLVERLRKREIAASLQRSEQGRQEWCALDHMIAREMATAKKEGRKPNFECQAMRSELLGYLIAGHETTSATIRWGVKFLITHQDAQSKLRGALREAYATAHKEKRMPTLLEIIKARIPYLEATVEEILRCAKVLPITARDVLVDTQVMGIPIPKGTPVVFVANGPGLTLPSTAIPIDEKKYRRSDNAKSYMKKYGRFEDSDIEEFRPERWLRTQRRDDGTEQVEFDANAGPSQSFGWGPRACFGRKLAYLKMRLFFTMAIWRFEFGELPEALGGYEETVFLARAPTNVYLQLQKA